MVTWNIYFERTKLCFVSTVEKIRLNVKQLLQLLYHMLCVYRSYLMAKSMKVSGTYDTHCVLHIMLKPPCSNELYECFVCVILYRLWVGQWAEPVIIFLSSCIPEAQVDRLAVHHHISWIIVESVGREEKVNDWSTSLRQPFISLVIY